MKITFTRSSILFVALAVLCVSALAGYGSSAPKLTAPAAFELMRGLVGEWTGTGQMEGGKSDVQVNYRLTGAGSAVVETLFPGTEHEMITVYHLDGSHLMLTHYCAIGNQPHMVLTAASSPQMLAFEFSGGTNMKSSRDQHMHSLKIRLVDPDHIESEWVSFKDGHQASTAKFTLTRKK